MRRAKVLLLLLLCSACKCGEEPDQGPADSGSMTNDGAPPPPPGTVSIEIVPADVELTIDGVTPAAQQFHVDAIDEEGNKSDVTSQAGLQLSDDAVGTLTGATFTTKLIGGSTTLTATLGQFTATAQIRVVLKRVVIVPGGDPLPADPAVVVGNAPDDPGRAPTLVYPNDGVMLPRNLGLIEIHFRPGPNNTLFAIRFVSPAGEIAVYTRCQPLADGCMYTPAPDVWQLLADTNSGTDPVAITVVGTDDAGTAAGTSDAVRARFSARRVDGGLYYWTTDGGRILRVDFGVAQQPEQFYPFDNNGTCYGCHSISKNGQHMTLSRSGQHDGRLTIIEIGTQAVLLQDQDDKREQFQSWDPTSSMFAGVWSDDNTPDTHIRIRDGQTGDVIESLDVGVEPDHPDWSPRGDRLLFTVVTRHQTSQRPGRGGISYLQQTAGAWGSPIELIAPADGLNRYYPAYAPDATFFIYCESTCPQGSIYEGSCDADADPSAKLWAMAADGGTAISLGKASGPGIADNGNTDLSNTFPKWAPFVDPQRRDGSGRLMWFTFSSRRQYGLRSPNGSDQWIWMAAIDPDAVARGEDGSFASFALPFQDLGTSNHIAQWTAAIVPTNPNDGGIDPNNGSDGGACLALGDVCDPGNDTCCTASTCTENGPGIYLCRPNI